MWGVGREERASSDSRGGCSEAVEAPITTTKTGNVSRDALPFSPAPARPNSH